jgi:uncharacterized protein
MAKSTQPPVATSKPTKTVKKVKKDLKNKGEEQVQPETSNVNQPAADVSKKVDSITIIKSKAEVSDEKNEISIEKKLMTLYSLQQIESQIDKIRIIRGELPLEVQDLEDEIAGLETRIDNYIQETLATEKLMLDKRNAIKDSQALIKKYEDQQQNPRNIREYDSLAKEIEFQNLEIQLAEKRIREFQQTLDLKKAEIDRFQKNLQDRKNDLEIKQSELKDIIAETEKEENELIRVSEGNRNFIEDRLITAYSRIRKNARNGLAVVQIERDACGGCFNKIPPQHQLDIRMHKKIIVCEYCGRILVDEGIVNAIQQK